MLREQIKKWFFEAVKLDVEAPSDLKESLLRGHPKLENFFDHLVREIDKADKILRSKGRVLKKETIQGMVYDLSKYFMKGMEGEAKRRYESEAQRRLREAEKDRLKEFDDFLSGGKDNEFAEEGVLSNEKIDQAREDGNFQESIQAGFQTFAQKIQ